MIVKLAVMVEDVDSEICEISMVCPDDAAMENSSIITWERKDSEPVGPEYKIEFDTSYKNEQWSVKEVRFGKKILTPRQELKELFASALLELSFQKQLDQADGIEHEHESENSAIVQVDKDPYDPKLIRVDTKPFSIHQVNEMIQNEDIDLSPDFQREFVWLDITRKSRLIESLLLRIPLPVFYLAQDEEGKFKVVDGVQRLTVIRDFLNNKFRLKNLEYLKDCEGRWYQNSHRDEKESLDRIYVRRIDQTQLFFNVIDPQTPEKVKYDIFRRINTGGKNLNAQEIRNCLEKPTTRKFVKQLAQSEEFLSATRHSISSTRMADNEIVLRFIAFYLSDHNLHGQQKYKGEMDAYLDTTVELLNRLNEAQLAVIGGAFTTAMVNAYLLFGERAFRKANLINKALFLSWSRILSDVPTDELKRCEIGTTLYEKLKKAMETDSQYSNALSMATNDVRNVDLSYDVAKKLLVGVMGNE